MLYINLDDQYFYICVLGCINFIQVAVVLTLVKQKRLEKNHFNRPVSKKVKCKQCKSCDSSIVVMKECKGISMNIICSLLI